MVHGAHGAARADDVKGAKPVQAAKAAKAARDAGGTRGKPLSRFEMRGYRVEYRVVSDGAPGPRRCLEVAGCGPFATQDLSIQVSRDAEALSFRLQALAPVLLDAFRVEVGHAFSRGERVLLNGYQSWTDTVWRPATAAMRGISHVPGPVVERYALDGIGDYRFAEYGGRGRQHGYTYAAFRSGGRFALMASLDEREGFTCIRTDVRAGAVFLDRECPAGVLGAGAEALLASFALLEGDEDAAYDRWFALSGVTARPVRPLLGYSSWYRHYGDIDRGKLEADLSGARQAMGALGLLPAQEGFTPLFQVDDGYCKVGDWLGVDAAAFPGGLAPIAAAARDAGFLPGLWMAPFVCERDSRVFAEHPDWLLRDESGSPVRTGPHWSGAHALDTRNPAVRAHVRESVRTAVREWGFGLLKLDFLYAACLLPHDGLNRGQLMRDAMELLRDAAGPECLLLGCGVPLASAFGIVDYCRIGCDVGLDWDDKPHMRLLHRERVSTRNSLANTLARAPLDGRAFGNDPDVFFLRDDVKMPAARRRALLRSDAECGSMLLTSDDMGAWGAAERGLFLDAARTLLARRG